MKILTRDKHIPCWFELSWIPTIPFRNKTPTIVFRIHNDLKAVFPDGGIIPAIQEEMDFLGQEDFKSLVEGRSNGQAYSSQFTNFLIPLPAVRKSTGLPCDDYDGKGKRYEDEDCFSCNGSGNGTTFDLTEINPICEKLAHLTTFLRFPPEQDTSADLPQLLSVETIYEQSMGGAALWGDYSVPLVNWLSSFGNRQTVLTEMVEAMRVAYTHMTGREYDSIYDFQAVIENDRGWLNVSCPGDACGLNPSTGHEWKHGEGYEFGSHNVDNAMQQLTLLAGLAVLHDMSSLAWREKKLI